MSEKSGIVVNQNQLNYISKNPSKIGFDAQHQTADQAIKKVLKDAFTVDSLRNVTFFRAQVLAKLPIPIPADSPASPLFGIPFFGPKPIYEFHVRIPELHSTIPAPTNFWVDLSNADNLNGKNKEEIALIVENNELIKKHLPKFIVFDPNFVDSEELKESDFVWTVFGNLDDLVNGYIFSKFVDGSVYVPPAINNLKNKFNQFLGVSGSSPNGPTAVKPPKNSYPQLPEEQYKKTTTTNDVMLCYLKTRDDLTPSLKSSAMIVFRNESGNGSKGINHNYGGVRGDVGVWSGNSTKIKGTVVVPKSPDDDTTNGSDQVRYITFEKPEDFMDFLTLQLKNKSFDNLKTNDEFADKYIKTWVAISDKEKSKKKLQDFKQSWGSTFEKYVKEFSQKNNA